MGEGIGLVGLTWRPGTGVCVLFCSLGIKIKDKGVEYRPVVERESEVGLGAITACRAHAVAQRRTEKPKPVIISAQTCHSFLLNGSALLLNHVPNRITLQGAGSDLPFRFQACAPSAIPSALVLGMV